MGCTLSDPAISGHSPASPTSPSSSRPSPLALPGTVAGATREQTLADLCDAVLRGARDHAPPAGVRDRLGAVGDAHRRHAVALRSPSPAARPTGLSASADPAAAQAVALIGHQETKAAAAHRDAALAATGSLALLWGSLAVAAEQYAHALRAETPGPRIASATYPPMASLSDVEAVQTLLRQVHAVVYGYQLALGRLSVSSGRHSRAEAGLAYHQNLRDRLESILVRRAAAVPPAEPAYVPSVAVRNASTAANLIKQMEVALLPFCGLWLAAAASKADRKLALDALSEAAARAGRWGAAPAVWPGWT